MTDLTYAGDLTPQQTWEMLKNEQDAVLIDVRTDAEFAYVGEPEIGDMSPISGSPTYANSASVRTSIKTASCSFLSISHVCCGVRSPAYVKSVTVIYLPNDPS